MPSVVILAQRVVSIALLASLTLDTSTAFAQRRTTMPSDRDAPLQADNQERDRWEFCRLYGWWEPVAGKEPGFAIQKNGNTPLISLDHYAPFLRRVASHYENWILYSPYGNFQYDPDAGTLTLGKKVYKQTEGITADMRECSWDDITVPVCKYVGTRPASEVYGRLPVEPQVNRLVIGPGKSLTWNSTPISPVLLAQYVVATKAIAPRPYLLVSVAEGAVKENIEAAKRAIRISLRCSPKF